MTEKTEHAVYFDLIRYNRIFNNIFCTKNIQKNVGFLPLYVVISLSLILFSMSGKIPFDTKVLLKSTVERIMYRNLVRTCIKTLFYSIPNLL